MNGLIYFETLGCKLNQIETESLAHEFQKAGFAIDIGHQTAASTAIEPILSVVNTCTVTSKAEQKARRLIRLLLRKFPAAPILVTGCYAELDAAVLSAIDTRVCVFPGSRKGELAGLPIWLSRRIASHPEDTLQGVLTAFCAQNTGDSSIELPDPALSAFRLSTDNFLVHSRASIKIQDGCNNHCSYCRIRLARGKSVSLDQDEVIARIRHIEDAGWAEVVITGVNLGQYRSGDSDLAILLERILAATNRISLRISSLYPERIDPAILPVLANTRIRPHFHLSVQSGSDRVLRAMRRPYTAETVYRAAERLRSIKENPFLACDIIAGFPGETDEDFARTVSLCRDIGFAWIHAFPFSARPGTEAWIMRPKIPERVASERVAVLTDLAEKNHGAYTAYWIGRRLPAIVEESSAGNGTHSLQVLTANYLSALIPFVSVSRGMEISVILKEDGKAEFDFQ